MEAQVIRTYLETMAELPWGTRADESLDLKRAAEILEQDHYGLKDVKDQVVEFLAVRQLRQREADRKSTRLNSSHSQISYAVFCLKKKNPSHARRTSCLRL